MSGSKIFKERGGYVSLISILVIGTAGTAITVSLLVSGIFFAKNILEAENAKKAGALSSACAEETLELIRDSTDFSGNGSYTLNGNNCDYRVINNGGESRTINIEALVGQSVRRIKINLSDINPLTIISSWQEVSDL